MYERDGERDIGGGFLMVGPVPTDERRSSFRRLKVGVALLVGVSAGLVAIQADASLIAVLAFVTGGTIVGAALAWYVFPSADAYRGR